MAEINYLDLLLQDLQDNSGMRKPAGAYDNMPFSASKFEKDLLSAQPIANLAFNSAYPGQAPIQIEAAAPELPVESPAPGVGTYSKIMTPEIGRKTEELNKAREAYGQMFQAYKEEEQPYEAALKKLSQPIPEYQPSMDFSGELGRLLKESAAAKEPQQSDLAQAILTLGPALASFGGEAGAIAAPKIASTSKEAYDASIKTMQTSNEAKRKAIANQIEALAKLQANDVVQFSEKQKTELSRLQAELVAQKGKVDINRASLKDSSTHLNKLGTELESLTSKAAEQVKAGEEKFGAAENLEKAKVAAAERKAAVDKELEALKQKSTLSLEDKKQQKALELEAEKLKGQLKLEEVRQKGREVLVDKTQKGKETLQKMKPVKGGAGVAGVEGKIAKLKSTDKARFDNALMVIKGINGMEQALDAGQKPFSVVGDNDYTLNRERAAEAFGRMQSGGAINKDEERRFVGMTGNFTDANEIRKTKLNTQKNEMYSRLKTLGFGKSEVDQILGVSSQTAPTQSNKVKVTNGSQTFMIDRSDLPAALKDKFKEVK